MQHETTVEAKSAESGQASKLSLPEAPDTETGPVKAWREAVIMRSYMPAKPDRNPLFLEKRVYQGSSGRIYPLPVIDRVEADAKQHEWEAVHLENEYLRLMVLPEIGGRIHVGLDKRNGYDFFYRQNVIKPALVGLAGPWISGGVEFNWPQHHRPATFMPVDVSIERDPDGSVTIWCSDHDPMVHMKGMHGLCLRPGRAYLEVRVRLHNRTTDTQTFLWWANVATHVHEKYQSFFPKDVRFAADHAKRAITEYPLSTGLYYGVDYGERARNGVPAEQVPSRFIADGSYPANDLSWYANIPVPTSYMVVGSRGDFAGGYDHSREAGLVSCANHYVAPGKKQWTWGNHEFGYAWDRSLTDEDGPYVELMAGAYTDNQPDFSFLSPGETKTFSQFWYPILDIGVPDLANVHGALRTETAQDAIRIHVQLTSACLQCTLRVRVGGKDCGLWHGDLTPDAALRQDFNTDGIAGDLEVVLEHDKTILLRYAPAEIAPAELPALATEPPLPQDVASGDELFLNGLHLEQYRHPTRNPEVYWMEAIRRDPGDSRSNHALGRWHMRRGEFALAEQLLRTAIARHTLRNPNPYDGEPHYNLGLTLLYMGREAEAYEALYKATWNAAWRGPAYHRLAEIDCCRSEWLTALEHVERTLRADTDNLGARNLKSMVLRRLGREDEAVKLLEETHALDPLDGMSRLLLLRELPQDGQQRLDLGLDFVRGAFFEEALAVVSGPAGRSSSDGSVTMMLYVRAYVLERLGREPESAKAYRDAAAADSDYVFPSRLEEMLLLEHVVKANPQDARAPYYLGNLLYDRRRQEEAIQFWEHSIKLDGSFPIAWRNLGFGYFNVQHDPEKALQAFALARELAPGDARLLYEQDQLLKRTGASIETRLAGLERDAFLVQQRDDLSVELASLYNSTGQPERALKLLVSRHFQPWEGGEGLVLEQYVRANVLLAVGALRINDSRSALEALKAAAEPPRNLSEAKHLLMNLSLIDYWMGVAYTANRQNDKAGTHWEKAARHQGDFQQMQVQPVSTSTFWSALALRKLGREVEAGALLRQIEEYASALERRTPKVDYFATSLPAMLLFEEDLTARQVIHARFLKAQALLGLCGEEKSRPLLEEVQQLDRNHTGAIDLLNGYKG